MNQIYASSNSTSSGYFGTASFPAVTGLAAAGFGCSTGLTTYFMVFCYFLLSIGTYGSIYVISKVRIRYGSRATPVN